MLGPEPDERAPFHLIGALGAIRRTQSLLLVDLEQTCRGDQAFLAAFRRWEEHFTAVRLQVLRAEARLYHLVVAGGPGEERTLPLARRQQVHARWVRAFGDWFAAVRIDTTYQRLDSLLDPRAEVVPADIVTDLAVIAEVAEGSMPALAELDRTLDERTLEDLAFYRVIAPWRSRGLEAMRQAEAWIGEMLCEHDVW